LVVWLGSADRAAFFQLKSMLQGVVARGTAAQIRALAPYVAGKTGTSDDENDAWFVGFTNEITIAVWVGYDNGEGKRRTLGNGQTGAKVALPIFEPILQAAWAEYAPRTALKGPSSEAQRSLMAVSIDLVSGDRLPPQRGAGFTEYFRRDRVGQIEDTQHKLISREEMYAYRDPGYGGDGDLYGYPRGPGPYGWQPYGQSPYGQYRGPQYAQPQYGDPRYGQYYGQPQRAAPPSSGNSFLRGLFGGRAPWEDEDRPRPRRVDPDYMWGQRR
jgi:membrane peptidoglycan carboxypeptidase